MPPTIRPEQAADAQAIERVTIDAFLNAPHTDHTEQFIVRALREHGALTVSLVAEVAGQIVGHVAVSPVGIGDASGDGRGRWFGLGPISVIPGHQGQGIGGELMRAALAALRDRSASVCVLLGDPGYYGRFGFRAVDGLVLPGVPAEYFLALSLDGAAWPQGAVRYHPAFNAKA